MIKTLIFSGQTENEPVSFIIDDETAIPTVFEYTNKEGVELKNNTIIDAQLMHFEQHTYLTSTSIEMIMLIRNDEDLNFFQKLFMHVGNNNGINFDINNKAYFVGIFVTDISLEYSHTVNMNNGVPEAIRLTLNDNRHWSKVNNQKEGDIR